MDYVGNTFRNTEVSIDGHSFRDCVFENATLHYKGGPATFNGCIFDSNLRWRLDGDLANGLGLIREVHRVGGGAQVKRLVDSFTNFFRKVDAPAIFTIH